MSVSHRAAAATLPTPTPQHLHEAHALAVRLCTDATHLHPDMPAAARIWLTRVKPRLPWAPLPAGAVAAVIGFVTGSPLAAVLTFAMLLLATFGVMLASGAVEDRYDTHVHGRDHELWHGLDVARDYYRLAAPASSARDQDAVGDIVESLVTRSQRLLSAAATADRQAARRTLLGAETGKVTQVIRLRDGLRGDVVDVITAIYTTAARAHTRAAAGN